MNKTLIKRHSSGLMVCSNGSVFVPPSIKRRGYITFGSNGCYLKVHYKGKDYSIHRLVAETFLPNPEGLRYVDHIDRNPHNNEVDNLRWVTASTNRLNTDVCDKSIQKYGIRSTDDKQEWQRRYRNTPEGRERIRIYNRNSRLRRASKCA